MKKRICASLTACALALTLCGGAAAVGEGAVLAPSGLCAGADGALVVADLYHRAIWLRDGDGALTRLAGRDGVRDVNGTPLGGYNDGAAAQAAFQTPWAVAPYLDGWAVTDTGNNAVRYLADGAVSTLAGGGKAGAVDGTGTAASFDGPTGLVSGADGSLYLADTGNNSIRKLDAQGAVTTYVDGKAGLLEPTGLCWADGVLYVADSGNHRVCKVEDGMVTVLAGGGADADGYRDGGVANARFSYPQGIAVGTDGTLYVADTGNGAVRALRDGVVFTLMKLGEGDNGLWPISPRGMALMGGKLYVGDVFARTLFTLDPARPAYSDVPARAWYASAVEAVSAWGVMGGAGRDAFAPNGALTGDMCAEVLTKLTVFLPEDAVLPEPPALGQRTVTRSELAALLWCCAGSPAASAALDAFADADAIPTGDYDAVRWCVERGLLSGRPGGTLDPAAAVTRAETAALLHRFLSL